ncbi:MAG: prepilin-type N-terminal cleavage/methylation domain-containing protein, partial [Gammaproteobacteria bacterium]|nr:prepilin-type N-terminal cleavage/methylation domain-containing protein [Gammaproteobacteria bacterium]
MKSPRSHAGFSLIELIGVIVLLGLLAAGAGLLILNPIGAYDAQVRRQQLVDQGEMALRQIARDLQRALPNSVRIAPAGAGFALEMVNIVDGARYRDEYGGAYLADPDFVLDFTAPDTAFKLLGRLNDPATVSPNHRLVIDNTSTNISAEAVDSDQGGIITDANTALVYATLNPGPNQEGHISLSTAFQFPQQSPGQRVFLVDSAISYLCNPATGTIVRYSADGFDNPQEIPPGGAVSDTLVSQVIDCNASYTSGTAQRGGILTFDITL